MIVVDDAAIDLINEALILKGLEITAQSLDGDIELLQQFLVPYTPFIFDICQHLFLSIVFHILILPDFIIINLSGHNH